MKQKPPIIAVIIVVVVVTLGFWYWQSSRQTAPPASETPAVTERAANQNTASATAPTLGGELYQKTQNPVGSKLPQTNPFASSIDMNPLRVVTPNPF